MSDYEVLKKLIDDEVRWLSSRSPLIVVVGVNDLSLYFIDQMQHLPGFVGIIPEDDDVVPEEYRRFEMTYADLVYLRAGGPRIYDMSKNGGVRTKSRLRDVGVRAGVLRLGYGSLGQKSGSKMIDAYDPLLGKTRVDEDGNPELVVFSSVGESLGEAPSQDRVRILTLGGSTSDPYFGNIKSWSEYLYEKLDSMGIACDVIAAGMATYDSFQELKKLIRDGVLLRPDIVISYSGCNEGRRSIREHPFSLVGDQERATYLVEHGLATHDTGIDEVFLLEHVSMGLRDERSRFQRWYENELMMHGVCAGLGISFIGALQPIRRPIGIPMPSLYQEAFAFFRDCGKPEWMLDMTSIFDDMQDVFDDAVHVYEEGNRKIAQLLLKEVLAVIDERKEAPCS